MCGAGHNIRLLLKKQRLLCDHIADAVHAWLVANAPPASIPLGSVS
jgi:IS5 family transposase